MARGPRPTVEERAAKILEERGDAPDVATLPRVRVRHGADDDYLDDQDDAPAVSSAPANAEQVTIEAILRPGDPPRSPDDYEALTEIPAAVVKAANQSGKLPIGRRGDRTGYFPSDVLAWITGNAIPYSLTPVAFALLNMTLEEAIDAATITDAPTWERKIGIPANVLEGACKDGKLAGSPHRLPGAAIIEWAEREGIRPMWPVSAARRVAAARIEAQQRAEAAAIRPLESTSRIDQAFSLAEEESRRQRESEGQARAKLWAEYAALLRRLAELSPTEAARFVALCTELAVTRERIERDVRLLAKIAELEATAATAPALLAEVQTANDELKRLRPLLRQQMADAESRVRRGWSNLADARQAPEEIRDLQRQRPELFPDVGA